MTDQKVTIMELKVDLQCPCCYKKIKKILCKFPQIRDQKYDEKQNTVTITVVCCSPEKIRDKLRCKGGKIIKSIEIKPPPKPKPPEKPKDAEKPKQPEKPKEPEKPKQPEKPKEQEKPKKPAEKPPPKEAPPPKTPEPTPKAPEPVPPPTPVPWCPPVCCGPCSEGYIGGPCYRDHGRPTCCGRCSQGIPGGPCYGDRGRPTCCGPCSEGVPGGPCYQGPRMPVPWYDNYGYGPYGVCGSRGGRVYYNGRCDYFCEENPSGCGIM